MLFRFSLYGFLKNQRYFEPFLVLAFLEKGLSFFLIGVLIAFREVAVNALEIPSGAVADVCGRRLSMVLAFAAYIVSFVVFGLAEGAPWLFAAMLFFAVGDAFRSGTHKALIFAWLREQGRLDERTRVYGYTRSWSKFGSAVSVLLAALFVFLADGYSTIFWISIVPYVIGVANLATYPASIDVAADRRRGPGQVLRHLLDALRETLRSRPQRRLVVESMGFEGVFHAVKDYLQPVLVVAATAWIGGLALTADLSEVRRTALLAAPVFFVLHLLSGLASRRAHVVVERAGNEDAAARRLWIGNAAVFMSLLAAAAVGFQAALILAFVGLHLLQNVWRPILISRFDRCTDESQGATVLSIESQAKRVGTILAAPLVGAAVDWTRVHAPQAEFWPVGAVGTTISLAFALAAIRRRASLSGSAERSR